MIPIIGTGLSGLVGSHLVELCGDEIDFENLDITTGVDITNPDLVKERISQSESEVVIHLAAFTDVDSAHLQNGDKTGSCYRINVEGTRNIAQACAMSNKYLIHISTDFVFDGQNPPPGGYTETDPPHPIEWYGQTKLWAEQAVSESGASAVIARITYPYRANFSGKKDLVNKTMDKLKDRTLPPMFTDHIITPTFIDDIVSVLRQMLDKRPIGTYHVVGSSHVSDYDLATTIADVFDLDKTLIKPGSLAEFLTTANRPYQKNMSTSNAKLSQEFGIHMSTLAEGLLKMKQQLDTIPQSPSV